MNKNRHERRLGSALRKAYRHYLVKAHEQIQSERNKVEFELGMKLHSKDQEIKALKRELKQVAKEKNKTLKECRSTIRKHWEAKLELDEQRNNFIIRANRLSRLISYLEKIAGENDFVLSTTKRLEKQSNNLLTKNNIGSLEEEENES